MTPGLVPQPFVARAGNTSDYADIQGHFFREIRITSKQQLQVTGKHLILRNYRIIVIFKKKKNPIEIGTEVITRSERDLHIHKDAQPF